MTCSACGAENREEARFCLQCGQRFSLACAACGAVLPSEARFCDECGTPIDAPAPPARASESPRSYTPQHLAEKILTSRSALEGERKQVTVLFADVVDSTAVAEGLDPEEWHGILDRCFRLLLEEVHRYEGSVNQFTGDGIMALFGAPIAQEDACGRAVRAALGMQASLELLTQELKRDRGIDFRMRIGIHTGPVVVGKIGDDLRMDYTAIGDTTNLAARLETAAPAGAIYVSEQTAKLVSGRFELTSVGPLVLKGKARPVAAYRLGPAQRSAPLVAPSQEGLTPLFGRAAELAALQTLFQHVREGRGQTAFVIGEAGIGKSRLLHEFRAKIDERECTWLEGRCISFGRGIPFLPIIDLVKHAFEIDESDDERAVIAKIQRGLEAFGPELRGDEAYLRALLAVDEGDPAVANMDASARRFATFDALKRLLTKSAERKPLVVLIEDLHWIDPASEEFLTYVVDALAANRILLLSTYRPGYTSSLADRSAATRLNLQTLSVDEAAGMAAAMLHSPEVPAEILALLAAKAEGNPFFVEEVTKSLIEIGAFRRGPDGYALALPMEQIIVPDTIQDVIMARIDRLGDDAKRAIQVASVIGREFALRLLQRAGELGDRVHPLVGELRTLELIYEKAGVPELAYMFKHALTHDVAYESLLLRRRRQLHQTIGLAIEELYADRLSEHWETLAHHFNRAEDWPRAFAYLSKAAGKALASFANSEALHFFERALELGAHVDIEPAQRASLLEGKARAHKALSQFVAAVEAYRAALALVSTSADEARIKTALAEALWYAHEFDEAIRTADEAIALAEKMGDLVTAGLAGMFRADVLMVRGDLEGAAPGFAETFRLATATRHRKLGAMVTAHRSMLSSWAGDYDAAIEGQLQALTVLRAENELLQVGLVSSHLGISLGGSGRYSRALDVLGAGIVEAEATGDRFWRARMWNSRGWILNELGAYEPAVEANRRCLEIAGEMGPLRMVVELVGNAECNLADGALACGDLPAAESHLATVAALVADRRNEWMTWRYSMHYQLTAAELALARGDLAAARRFVEACLVTARRTRSRRYLVRAGRILAACHLAAGDHAGAEGVLCEAVAAARALGNPPQLWQALLAHGRALHHLGRRDEAAAAWAEGLGSLESTGRDLRPDLRAALLASRMGTALRETTS